MTWIKITNDEATLPPVGQVVFVVDIDMRPFFLVREWVDDDGHDAIAWCKPYDPHYDLEQETWMTISADWDDEYNPLYWHELPHPPVNAAVSNVENLPPCPRCGQPDVVRGDCYLECLYCGGVFDEEE